MLPPEHEAIVIRTELFEMTGISDFRFAWIHRQEAATIIQFDVSWNR